MCLYIGSPHAKESKKIHKQCFILLISFCPLEPQIDIDQVLSLNELQNDVDLQMERLKCLPLPFRSIAGNNQGKSVILQPSSPSDTMTAVSGDSQSELVTGSQSTNLFTSNQVDDLYRGTNSTAISSDTLGKLVTTMRQLHLFSSDNNECRERLPS